MTGAKTPILHGVCQGDFDLAGWKLLNVDLSALASGAPFSDATSLIKGSSDATKLARFEIDGFTAGAQRVFTLPNYDGTLATRAGVEDFTNKTLNGLTFGGTGGFSLTDAVVSITGTLVFDGDFSVLGSGATCTLLLSADTTLTLPVSGTVATTAQLPVISDVAYDATSWNGNLDGASKNAIRDKIEGLLAPPFSDANNLLVRSNSPTTMAKFTLSGLTIGVTRTLTVPNKSGTLALLDDVPDTAGIIFDADIADRNLYLAGNVSFFAPFTLTGGLAILTSQVGGSQVTLPASGTLATVAGTIPFSYLDNNKELGGITTSDAKVATQKAVKSYVDARTGRVVPPDNDGQVQSATVVDLVNQPYQLEVLGTTGIDAFTMEAGDEHILVFEGVLDLTDSASLILPGGADITTAAGDYAVINETSGATKVSHFQRAAGGHVADIVGGTIHHLAEFGIQNSFADGYELLIARGTGVFSNDRTLSIRMLDADRTLTIGGDVQFGGAFSTIGITQFVGAFTTSLIATATTDATLPAGTHILQARDGYATTVTAAGTTTLVLGSKYQQFFTGVTTQTVVLPVASTLTLGYRFRIVNLSSGNVTVQSSGGNSVVVLSANTAAILTCILASGTSAASWSAI